MHAPKHGNSETPAGSGGGGAIAARGVAPQGEGREEGSVFRIEEVCLMARGGVRISS